MFCTRDIKRRKKNQIKKRKRQTATGASVRCESRATETCMVPNLLYDLFIVPCLQRVYVSVHVSFLYTVPLTGSPCCTQCLARFILFFLKSVFLWMLWTWPAARPLGSAFFQRVSVRHVESTKTCIRTDLGTGAVRDDGGEFVCSWHQFVSFHEDLPFIIIPETSNKTMGMKTLSQKTLLLLN